MPRHLLVALPVRMEGGAPPRRVRVGSHATGWHPGMRPVSHTLTRWDWAVIGAWGVASACPLGRRKSGSGRAFAQMAGARFVRRSDGRLRPVGAGRTSRTRPTVNPFMCIGTSSRDYAASRQWTAPGFGGDILAPTARRRSRGGVRIAARAATYRHVSVVAQRASGHAVADAAAALQTLSRPADQYVPVPAMSSA